MGLVEPIAGEVLHQIVYLLSSLERDVLIFSSFEKLLLLSSHLLPFLLPHSAAQYVSFSHSEPCQPAGNLHNLLLVDYHPMGLSQNLLQFGDFISGGYFPMLPPDELIYHPAANGTGAIESVKGNQVVKFLRIEPPENVLHTGAFKLEDAGCPPFGKEPIGFGVIEGEEVKLNFFASGLSYIVYGLLDYCEGAQPEEVHLQQANLLQLPHGILGSYLILSPL